MDETEETLEQHRLKINHSIKMRRDDFTTTDVPVNFINQHFMLERTTTKVVEIVSPGLFRYERITKTKCDKTFLEYFVLSEAKNKENKTYSNGEYMTIDKTGLIFVWEILSFRTYPLVNADNAKPN